MGSRLAFQPSSSAWATSERRLNPRLNLNQKTNGGKSSAGTTPRPARKAVCVSRLADDARPDSSIARSAHSIGLGDVGTCCARRVAVGLCGSQCHSASGLQMRSGFPGSIHNTAAALHTNTYTQHRLVPIGTGQCNDASVSARIEPSPASVRRSCRHIDNRPTPINVRRERAKGDQHVVH